MAVEARHVNSWHPLLVCDNSRQLLNGFDENLNMYGHGGGGMLLPPLSEITTEAFLPMYCTTRPDSFLTQHPQPQSHSRVFHTLPLTRKRTRNHLSCDNNFTSFLGEDISPIMQNQQREIHDFIAHHVEKIRSQVKEHRDVSRRRIREVVEGVIVKKLRAKEEELERIVNLNRMLHEKVKSLSIENQMWRDLAQTNEATVTTLRTNIEQVMRYRGRGIDNAESCCSSNGEGEEEEDTGGENAGIWCRKCGKEESCVLLLPCRHLCVCSVCGLGLNICPVCKSTRTASVVVNNC